MWTRACRQLGLFLGKSLAKQMSDISPVPVWKGLVMLRMAPAWPLPLVAYINEHVLKMHSVV
jgi:hypothetical protein